MQTLLCREEMVVINFNFRQFSCSGKTSAANHHTCCDSPSHNKCPPIKIEHAEKHFVVKTHSFLSKHISCILLFPFPFMLLAASNVLVFIKKPLEFFYSEQFVAYFRVIITEIGFRSSKTYSFSTAANHLVLVVAPSSFK